MDSRYARVTRGRGENDGGEGARVTRGDLFSRGFEPHGLPLRESDEGKEREWRWEGARVTRGIVFSDTAVGLHRSYLAANPTEWHRSQ